MPTYKAPVNDTVFLLNDVFDYARYANTPGFAEAPIDVVEHVLTEGAKFVEEVVQPLNRIGDLEGCKRHDDGSVTTPKASRRPIRPSSRAAGSAFPATPNTAARACPTSSRRCFPNTRLPPIWPSRCTPASPTAPSRR